MGTAPQALIKMIPRIAPEVNPVRNSSPAIAGLEAERSIIWGR